MCCRRSGCRLQVEELGSQLLEVDGQQKQDERSRLRDVGFVHVAFDERGAIPDAGLLRILPRQLDHLRVVFDADGARAALRGADDVAAVARPQIHDEVLRRDLGDVEHLLDERFRSAPTRRPFPPVRPAARTALRLGLRLLRDCGAGGQRADEQCCDEGYRRTSNVERRTAIRHVQISRTPWLRTRKYAATTTSSAPLMAMTSGAPMNGRQVAADQAAERHAAAEREHVDAHHAAAHLVRRDQLDERGDRREHDHQRRAGEEQQQLAQPERRATSRTR